MKHVPSQYLVYVLTNKTTIHAEAIQECVDMGGYLAMPKSDSQLASAGAMIADTSLGNKL